MKISSPGIEEGGAIPERCSREGGNKMPTLHFEDVPSDAVSLVLIMENPDAPQGAVTHWIVYNLAPATRGLNEDGTPMVLHQGRNDYGQDNYSGPKSPAAEHRYCFRLYALDASLTLTHGSRRLDVEEAMIGHVIATADCHGHFAALAPVAG